MLSRLLSNAQKPTQRMKMKGWKKIFHANGNQKNTGIAILISNNIDFKPQTVIRNKEGHCHYYDKGVNL